MELEDRLVEDFSTADELCDCRGMGSSCTAIMYDSLQLLIGDEGADKIERSDWYKEMSANWSVACVPEFLICRSKGNLLISYFAESKFPKNVFRSFTRGSGREVLSQEEVKFMTIFSKMWIYVPTPFQTGDIVVSESGPAVLHDWKLTPENTEYIRRMEQGGQHDMQCSVQDMAENSYIVRSGSEFYLRLEYYQGEIPADKKFLIALSSYYKSEIGLSMLLEAHGLHQKAFDFRSEQRNMCECYAKVALERMGIDSTWQDED